MTGVGLGRVVERRLGGAGSSPVADDGDGPVVAASVAVVVQVQGVSVLTQDRGVRGIVGV